MSYLTRLKLKLIGEINAIPQFLQGNYFTELAGLRGIAIILVLLYHLGINHFLRRYNCWILGRLGVDIFFVLSGFLITTILLKEKVRTQHISLRKFYIRRALRIMPVAYLYLIVIFINNYIFHLNIDYKSFISGFLNLKNLPISGINDTFTEHFWSLSVEEQFYLFFPLLLVISINKTTLIASLSVLGILIFSLLGYHQIGLLCQFRPLTLVCKFFMFLFWEGPFTLFIGSLFAILSFKNVINFVQFKHKSFLSLILFILAIAFHSNTFYFYTQYLSEFIFDCLIGCIIILSIGSRSLFSKLLNAKWLIWIGTISYSIYIWQQLINLIPLYWVDHHLFGFSHDALFVLVDLGRLIAILALASFSYYFIERRFLKLKAHFE